MVAAFGTGTWGRGRESHLDLKPLEGVAKAQATRRRGRPRQLIIGLALALAHAAAATVDGPAGSAVCSPAVDGSRADGAGAPRPTCGWGPCTRRSEPSPPHLDRAGGVLALDLDAVIGRERELQVVLEQHAICRVQGEEHARDGARQEVGEAEAERDHPHEEALPFVHREEVGPLEAAIGALDGGSPSAEEGPEFLRRGPRRILSEFASPTRQPASGRRLQADDSGEDAREPQHVGRCSGLRREPRHVRRIERHRCVEVANTARTRERLQLSRFSDECTTSDGFEKTGKPSLPR